MVCDWESWSLDSMALTLQEFYLVGDVSGGRVVGTARPACFKQYGAAVPSNLLLFASFSATTRSSLVIIAVWGKMSPRVLKASKKEVSLTHPPKQFMHFACLISTSFLLG